MCETRLAIPSATAACSAASSATFAQQQQQQQQQTRPRNCAPPPPSPSRASATLPPPAADTATWNAADSGTSEYGQSQNCQPAADSSCGSMGQCYPKCMPTAADDAGLARAARASRPRHSLAAMKHSPTSAADDDGDGDMLEKLATLDLEELAAAVALDGEQPPKSIVVDYEDDAVQLPRRRRQNSVTDCARAACGPLGSAFAPQPPGEQSALPPPLTPSRRRARKDSLGNNASSSAMTPRRGKSTTMLALDKMARADPASPSTDTETSEADERCSSVPKLCMCEVSQHKSHASCWLVAGEHVYDVTGILDAHPGGARSLLRKAGGPDCTQDMKFHTKNARKMLDKCFIGKLQPCGDTPERGDSNCSIM